MLERRKRERRRDHRRTLSLIERVLHGFGVAYLADRLNTIRTSTKTLAAGVGTVGVLEVFPIEFLQHIDRADTITVLLVMYATARLANPHEPEGRDKDEKENGAPAETDAPREPGRD